jgi:hypothetical protein
VVIIRESPVPGKAPRLQTADFSDGLLVAEAQVVKEALA